MCIYVTDKIEKNGDAEVSEPVEYKGTFYYHVLGGQPLMTSAKYSKKSIPWPLSTLGHTPFPLCEDVLYE